VPYPCLDGSIPGIPMALDKLDEESGRLPRAPSTGNSDISKLCPTGSGTTIT